MEYIAGGATQNSIRVAQWMLGRDTGKTAYIGCIGKDKFGEKLKDAARADGVAVHYLEDEGTETGTCAVLVDESERSLVANLAAANCYKKEHIEQPEVASVLANAQFVYMAGFFLTVSPDTIQHVAEQVAAENKVLAMNLSAPFLVEFFKDPMMAALPYTDYLFGNESEAEAFGKVHGIEGGIEGVAKHLSQMEKKNGSRPRTVVITQGKDSTLVAVNGEVRSFPVQPLPEDKLVDTNGAGDAFVGGFLARLVEGKSLEESVEAGHFASRVIIQRSGCTFPAEIPASA